MIFFILANVKFSLFDVLYWRRKLTKDDKWKLKDTEVRIIVELMKNSRKSDREIAKAVGVSQPTVSRTIQRFEKEGLIEEYTIIPNFHRLGYDLMAFQFLEEQETQRKEERAELRKAAEELEKSTPQANMTVVDGVGLGKGRVLINLYRNYGDYTKGISTVKSLPNVRTGRIESFIVDLSNELNFRVLSMKQIARHIEALTQRRNRNGRTSA